MTMSNITSKDYKHHSEAFSSYYKTVIPEKLRLAREFLEAFLVARR